MSTAWIPTEATERYHPATMATNVASTAPATPSRCPVPYPRISTGASTILRTTVRIWMPTVGFTTPLPRRDDLRDQLAASVLRLHDEPKKASSQVSRLLHRLHVHGLVARIPRSRRWRVTAFGHSAMGTAVKLRQRDFPGLYPVAA